MDFVPVLVQIFVTILLGYLSGKSGLISPTESVGLSRFITYFALPALIFKALATFSFGDVSWSLIVGIFVGKTIVFVAVVLLTMLLTRPTNIGKAGLYGILATQSNDFALGYPLLVSLYKNTQTLSYADYLYVLAPVQLLMINPFGILMLEMNRHWEQSQDESNKPSIVVTVAKGILKNPIVVMTVLGILWNFLLDHQLPEMMAALLETLSQAFSAVALFLLGLCLVGKLDLRESDTLFLPMSLVVAKILVLPIVIRSVIEFLWSSEKDISDLSSFGFLYGTFPAAPTAFVFALQYDVGTSVAATGMALSTFASAPLMFVSATMVLVNKSSYQSYIKNIEEVMSYVTFIAIPCCIWVLITFVIYKKWKSVTHRFSFILVCSQLLCAIGGNLWQYVGSDKTLLYHLQHLLSVGGKFSSRVWTAMVALTLTLLYTKGLCFVIRINKAMIAVAVLITGVFFAIVALFPHEYYSVIDPNFEYGRVQEIFSAVLLGASIVMTATCMVLQQYHQAKIASYQALRSSDNSGAEDDDPVDVLSPEGPSHQQNFRIIPDVEDLADGGDLSTLCSVNAGCDIETKKQCISNLRSYRRHAQQALESSPLLYDEIHSSHSYAYHQVKSHVILVLLLIFSMLVGLAVCIGKGLSGKSVGVWIELEFLDVVLNYGQGIISFIVFGLDFTLISNLIMKFLGRQETDSTTVAQEHIKPETKYICQQFKAHHREKCFSAITFEMPQGNSKCSVFKAADLVNWLMEEGITSDRRVAVEYGQHLLVGGIIENFTLTRLFRDNSSLCRFVCD